jgi:hypothetical protein
MIGLVGYSRKSHAVYVLMRHTWPQLLVYEGSCTAYLATALHTYIHTYGNTKSSLTYQDIGYGGRLVRSLLKSYRILPGVGT